MMPMQLGMGIGLTFGGSPSAAAGPYVPSSYSMAVYGDSRVDSNGSSNTFTSAQWSQNRTANAIAMWVEVLSGGKLRHMSRGNFGIATSKLMTGITFPRYTAVADTYDRVNLASNPDHTDLARNATVASEFWRGASVGRTSYHNGQETGCGPNNKNVDILAASNAGIVLFLYGTNDQDTTVYNSTGLAKVIEFCQDMAAVGKLVVILNETPRGINQAGGVQNAFTTTLDAAFRNYSNSLLTLDRDSGNANAQPNVYAVDSFNEAYDSVNSPAGNYYPKQGYCIDGLHPTPYASKRYATLIVNRLTTAWGSLGSLTAVDTFATPPTANGLSSPAASQPYINVNPLLTKTGTAGTVSGTWNTAPTAAEIPEKMTISAVTPANVNCTATNGQVGPDGLVNAIKLDISITSLANNTTNSVTLQETIASSSGVINTLIAANRFAVTDKLRARVAFKVASGHQYLAGVSPRYSFTDQNSKIHDGQGAKVNLGHFWNMGLYTVEADTWYTVTTDVFDLQDAEFAAACGYSVTGGNALLTSAVISFSNTTGATVTTAAATVYLALFGLMRVSG